jgi:hypothetical protein
MIRAGHPEQARSGVRRFLEQLDERTLERLDREG